MSRVRPYGRTITVELDDVGRAELASETAARAQIRLWNEAWKIAKYEPQAIMLDARIPEHHAAIVEVLGQKIADSARSFLEMLERVSFWEPARFRLENGGCRQ